MCFPKFNFCYRRIESTDILIHVFLLKLQGGRKKKKKKRVGKLCYHMLSQMEKQFVLGIMYVRRLRYLPTVTDNKSFLLRYIKKEMKERIWERSVLSNIWEQLSWVIRKSRCVCDPHLECGKDLPTSICMNRGSTMCKISRLNHWCP